ncbi:MAG TPA: acetyl-CoA carboxylase, carboxyltransferase subunit beta [Verrucomicrobiales bacterium]|nr:acetyl-CoA carboxylase, carboxyltransferase subunit beta [Verrucomicrobiales bacterium]
MAFFKKLTLKGFGEKKKDMPEGQWHKCPGCKDMFHEIELADNLRVCPKCAHHYPLDSEARVASLVDEGTWDPMDLDLRSENPLGFKGYGEKVEANMAKTGLNEAVATGRATVQNYPVTLGVMDFRFQGASMGSVVGEKLTRAIEAATEERRGCIIVSASGGARMQEGILSLMQMAKTSGALAMHHEAGLPFISVLTHPTFGGTTASFATLGDIILAEPGSIIGFAGPVVIRETTHQKLPPGFQTAEFMLEHGLVDRIVSRHDLRTVAGNFLRYMMPPLPAAPAPAPQESERAVAEPVGV